MGCAELQQWGRGSTVPRHGLAPVPWTARVLRGCQEGWVGPSHSVPLASPSTTFARVRVLNPVSSRRKEALPASPQMCRGLCGGAAAWEPRTGAAWARRRRFPFPCLSHDCGSIGVFPILASCSSSLLALESPGPGFSHPGCTSLAPSPQQQGKEGGNSKVGITLCGGMRSLGRAPRAH